VEKIERPKWKSNPWKRLTRSEMVAKLAQELAEAKARAKAEKLKFANKKEEG